MGHGGDKPLVGTVFLWPSVCCLSPTKDTVPCLMSPSVGFLPVLPLCSSLSLLLLSPVSVLLFLLYLHHHLLQSFLSYFCLPSADSLVLLTDCSCIQWRIVLPWRRL